MTYVKRGAQLLLVDDDKVQKYIDRGFAVFELPGRKPAGVNPPEAPEPPEAPKKKPAAKSEGDPDAKDGE